ncbi:MAG: hypothetical protein R3E31_24965 [Chloroflexota bacterium]
MPKSKLTVGPLQVSGAAGMMVTVALAVAVTTSAGPMLYAVQVAVLTVVWVMTLLMVNPASMVLTLAPGVKVYARLLKMLPSWSSTRSWRVR